MNMASSYSLYYIYIYVHDIHMIHLMFIYNVLFVFFPKHLRITPTGPLRAGESHEAKMRRL